MAIEDQFNAGFVAKLTAEEKQIQQNYRPVIGVHKWFARRPGALFRSLLLSEFNGATPLAEAYFEPHSLSSITIGDPFMGGGTTLFEASRMGCNVVGYDINPMAFWVVRQELVSVDRACMRREAEKVIADVAEKVEDLYRTKCKCGKLAPVKYFLWVKQQNCSACKKDFDLFPGYLIAENSRHPNFVLHCPCCDQLVEFESLPPKGQKVSCPECRGRFDWSHGPASRNKYTCSHCNSTGRYPAELSTKGPPRHRLIGMEYHCRECRPTHKGRFFKSPDADDLKRVKRAKQLLAKNGHLPIPEDRIPDGDETKRLHKWGYDRYREMFNERQLVTLALLMERIRQVKNDEARHALATVFSDSLRYQNMLCRYDSYALKCQDIFAVHGFPVGLIQCENNVLGIPKIGSGSFCHFIEKYDRAKEYCERPFETIRNGSKKTLVPMEGERIDAELVTGVKELKGKRKALINQGSITDARLPAKLFDAVFTDPPYFDNVQYAELMDFCFVWLRLMIGDEFKQFSEESTRSLKELTGNITTGKGLDHFTEGLSAVFTAAAKSLKPGGPFVFTYHHNQIEAYVPVVVAILDAGLYCTATLAAAAEMTASLHINGTGSSVMDTVIVCRAEHPSNGKKVGQADFRKWIERDQSSLTDAGLRCTKGDLNCLALGHLTRATIACLHHDWDRTEDVSTKMHIALEAMKQMFERCNIDAVIEEAVEAESALSE